MDEKEKELDVRIDLMNFESTRLTNYGTQVLNIPKILENNQDRLDLHYCLQSMQCSWLS